MNTLTYPTFDELYTAFIQANDEFTKANGAKLAEYETMFIIKNSRLRGHVQTRRTAVASWDWDIVPYDKKDAEIAQLAKARLSEVVNKIIPSRINTPLFGFFAADIEFILPESGNERKPVLRAKYQPDSVIAASPDQVKVHEAGKEVIKQRQSLSIAGSNINPIVTIIETDGEDYRGGQLLSVAVSELLRLDMLAEWANWARKQKGMIQGVDLGADEQERAEAESGLKNLLKNNYIITSDYFEYKFHQIANSSAGSSFKDMIAEFNNSISVAILGQANTSELPSGGGSRAAVQVQALVSKDVMYSDVIATTELINKQLLPFDFYFNKGSIEPPYQFQVKLAEQADHESNITVIREALTAGVPLLRSEIYDKIGFSVPSEGDDVIAGVPA